MDQSLSQESEKLVRSWERHEAAWLKDYLVSGVEDPRINVQSVLSRHFLIEGAFPGSFGDLMRQEFRFAAAMNCLLALTRRLNTAEDLEAVQHALKQGSDNADGIEIPSFVLEMFALLPTSAGDSRVPNYIESFVRESSFENRRFKPHESSLDTFRDLWKAALNSVSSTRRGGEPAAALSVLEPACGSANDYRQLDSFGVAQLINYTGQDLSGKNITNARSLFPGVCFEVGNAFEIARPDKSFDRCFVHDLFEHLSLEGMETAVKEICRVTRHGLCIGFFSMDETQDHAVRAVEEYHWNTLSMKRTKELFERLGFAVQVIHIGTFLRREVGCEFTHNPNAYTFIMRSTGIA